MAQSWLFQSNPSRFDIDNAVIEAKSNNIGLAYAVNRYRNEYKLGQIIYIWRSQGKGKYKKTPGIIARGKIIKMPEEIDFPKWEIKYLRGGFAKGLRVVIEIDSIADETQVLTKQLLKKQPLLSDHPIIINPQGTNFKLTKDQAKKLEELWPKKQFPFTRNEKIRRTIVHEKIGGSRQGGICPTKSGDILVFSDPKIGKEFGYHDGWDANSYMYFGEGQEGDMEFTRGNKAIRDHKKNGDKIYLFHGAKGEVVYENQFELDEKNPFQLVEAKDKHDEDRQAIIFKLNPVVQYQSQLPKTNLSAASETKAEVVSQEAFENESSERKQKEKIVTSTRKESKLLKEYNQFREKNGEFILERYKITIKGQQRPLWTDGWDEHNQILIEAKSSSLRNHIRLAIGQLLDYQRHINPKPKKLAILLPTRPQDDLIKLIVGLKIDLIFKEDGIFKTL